MLVRQISIFMQNKPGALASLTRHLKGAKINLIAISVPDTREQGILRLVPEDPKALQSLLRAKGISFTESKVLAVDMTNRPGGLYAIAQKLKTAKIDVEYAYGSTGGDSGTATIILQVSDLMRAQKLLTLG